MTNTPSDKVPPEAGTQKLHGFYPLTKDTARALRAIGLHASEWRLWSFLVTFEPFGTEYVELPELQTIMAECGISKATFYRAIAKFQEHDLFDTQPSQIFIRNLRGSKASPVENPRQRLMDEKKSLMDESECLMDEKKSLTHENFCLTDETIDFSENNQNQDPESDRGDQAKCTNNRSKDLKNNRTVPPTRPVTEADINREGFGTGEVDPLTAEIEELCTQIQQAGVRPNKTIQATLYTLLMAESSPRVARLVENAISALQEQQAKGTVKNSGGFLNAALRRNFTANQAKVEARVRRQEPARPQPPALNQVSIAVDIAMQQHRDRAIEILQDLWERGWHDQVEELLTLRKDWRFSLTDGGVKDATS